MCAKSPPYKQNAFLAPAWRYLILYAISSLCLLWRTFFPHTLMLSGWSWQLSSRYQVKTVFRYYTIVASAVQHSDSTQQKFTQTHSFLQGVLLLFLYFPACWTSTYLLISTSFWSTRQRITHIRRIYTEGFIYHLSHGGTSHMEGFGCKKKERNREKKRQYDSLIKMCMYFVAMGFT